MGKRLLPCPVCGGESFIESVTQGGLICSDCGAVSNQVEVAEDEDPATAPKVFVRTTSYRHVTEEESQAKRDRRVVLKMADRRDAATMLEGLGLILEHMVETLISHELCPPLAATTVRETWFDLLDCVSAHSSAPRILKPTHKKRALVAMSQWGIPSAEEQAELVMKDLPVERLKRIQGLNLLMQDRRMDPSRLKVIEESQFFIYAHDWLCVFFDTPVFPLPDWVLIRCATAPITWELLQTVKTNPDTSNPILLSDIDRKVAIRKLFLDIIQSPSVRKGYDASLPIADLDDGVDITPELNVGTLLSVLVVGIRNACGGVLPVHVVNWVARGQLPYFSAHMCLPPSVDRIEYYRVPRSNHGYARSVFAPLSTPTPEEVDKCIEKMRSIGVKTSANDPSWLVRSCLDMLGLQPLGSLATMLVKQSLVAMMTGVPSPFTADSQFNKNSNTWNPYVETGKKLESNLFSDISLNQFIVAAIAVAMKLVFPALHRGVDVAAGGVVHPLVDAVLANPMEYSIVGPSEWGHDAVGEVEWWDSMTGDEKSQFLDYVENEQLTELRECIVQDLRGMLSGSCKLAGSASSRRTLQSGRIPAYQLSDDLVDTDSDFFHLVGDLQIACQCEERLVATLRVIRRLERFIFSP